GLSILQLRFDGQPITEPDTPFQMKYQRGSITAGLFLKFYIHISEHDKQYIGFPGEILMQMVQLMTVCLSF
ncbi:hypothetical protein KUCAC02_022116, partial [Chaenocephalus aceratus]